MKKPIAVFAIIGLAIGLTWAAEQVGGLLGFAQQDTPAVQAEAPGNEDAPGNTDVRGNEGAPGSESVPGNEGVAPSGDAVGETQAGNDGGTPAPPELSEEVASIEEDLARIEEALESEEVLEEFTPSEPLSADNPVPWPTDI